MFKSENRTEKPANGESARHHTIQLSLAYVHMMIRCPARNGEVADQPEGRRQLEAALRQYHCLGYRSRAGQNLLCWVCDWQDRPLGCVVFGAPAWQCAVRDEWIGWSPTERARFLGGILDSTRFLIFSWVRVPQLASHILSQVSCRIARDCRPSTGNRSGCWKRSSRGTRSFTHRPTRQPSLWPRDRRWGLPPWPSERPG